jgi:UDPglucose 6-dehydrogenase
LNRAVATFLVVIRRRRWRTCLRTRRAFAPDAGVPEALAHTRVTLRTLDEVVRDAELLFVTIQTPHGPSFDGTHRLSETRSDFDYGPLCAGIDALTRVGAPRNVALASTVLPGTTRPEVLPRLGPLARLCYSPFFIAMGTTMRDLLAPECVLLGVHDDGAATRVEHFYRTLHDAPIQRMGVEDAELTKVLYNTWISTKICFANTATELAHRSGATVDRVLGVLSLGRQRILSPMYLRGGMGDGGGCHLRDNLALRWFARTQSLSRDWFEGLLLQRDRHTEWIARTAISLTRELPVVMLGKSFKAESASTGGGLAQLLARMFRELGCEALAWDPMIDAPDEMPRAQPRVLRDRDDACFVCELSRRLSGGRPLAPHRAARRHRGARPGRWQPMKDFVVVCVPVLNDCRGIAEVLPHLEHTLATTRLAVCVVDDGSVDGTLAWLDTYASRRSYVHVLHRKKTLPGCRRGGAIRDGLRWRLAHTNHDVFVDLDADGFQRPEELTAALAHLDAHPGCDVVVASKHAYGAEVIGRPLTRRFGSRVYNTLVRAGLGTSVRDCSNSFRVYRRRAAEAVARAATRDDTPVFLVEMMAV